MSQNYVVPNINDDLQTRLQSMTEQILSRTRLLVIIDKLHLYGAAQGRLSDDQKVASMRKDIGIDLVRNPGRQDISSFTISYSAGDPHLAQQVTAELTGLFISENLKVRQQESEGTTDFLEKQLEDARAEPVRTGGEGSAIREPARRSFAHARTKQSSNPGRPSVTATRRPGRSEYGKTTTGLPAGTAGAGTDVASDSSTRHRSDRRFQRRQTWPQLTSNSTR